MRKVSEYEAHALECRQMAAKTSNPIQKQQLLAMAEAWTMLATERRKQLTKPWIDHSGSWRSFKRRQTQ